MENENLQPVDAGAEVIAQPLEAEVVEQNVVQEPQTEKQPQSQEENSKYAAARREAEAKAKALEEKVSRLESLTAKAGFESVDSFAEAYEKQLAYEEEQQRRSELEEQGIDPDIYEQMIENDPRIKAQREAEFRNQTEQQKKRDINSFLDYFEEANGRPFDSKVDSLCEEVQSLWESGVPLVTAYKATKPTQEINTLKAELEQLRAQLSANKTNERNAVSSTGSIVPGAVEDNSFISKEVFDANKGNQRWVMNNLEKLTQSRKKW